MRTAWLSLIALAACGDNIDGRAPAPPTCLPDCAASRDYDATSYHFAGSWDWASTTVTVSEDIALDTTASGPIVELDSKVSIAGVHAGDQDLAFVVDGDVVHVDLTPIDGGAFTVDYTAVANGDQAQTTGTALLTSTSDPSDPVRSRVVLTDSEPDRALLWLVTKLDPSDRALWSVDLTIDADEDAIANGERTGDKMVDGRRVVSYALDKPIPAYMMAWAAGELEHSDRDATGDLPPTSVWFRKGFVLDPNLTLDHIADAMTTFQGVLGPYPWSRYSVVLLPYSGGMENATITFDNELSGQGPGEFVLTAHELGHHWFGDYVTMNRFQDVWFKEGMATTLEAEAQKHTRDRAGVGRRWGRHMAYNPDDAVVDDTLHGLDKYTSGPYERAGWVIAQIRTLVGEDQFWSSERAFLDAHAYGSATGEEFVNSFPLTDDQKAAFLAVLPLRGAPQLGVAKADGEVTLTLNDPQGLIVAPYGVGLVDPTGGTLPVEVPVGVPTVISLPAGGYLELDPDDTHPTRTFDNPIYNQLKPQLAPAQPAAAGALATVETMSAASQEDIGSLPVVATDIPAYIAALDSDIAKVEAVQLACVGDHTDVVEPLLVAPVIQEFDPGYALCDAAFARATLEPEIAPALASGTPADLARVEYLLSFDYGADETAVLQMVAQQSPSFRLLLIVDERSQFGHPTGPGQLKRVSSKAWCKLHGACAKR